MRILIVYGTTHGHTARIAERIASRLRERGAAVTLAPCAKEGRPAEFDGTIVGARVHGSRYPWRVDRFIRRHHRALACRPSAFFSVSLLQLSPDRARSVATHALPARRITRLGWSPELVKVFGGALYWRRQYGRLAPLFKQMWRRTLGPVLDTALEEQIFTNWDDVDRFADDFFELTLSRVRPGITRLPSEEFAPAAS
ncbi:MAG TPA: flavodoxin domain-containing protein [Polyangiaceae bacterium]|nr:flavodoxin domain-containing protein [Polyangiaceae bacterium]